MTGKTLFGPDWYQDPNDNRIHDENGDDILDKHSLGELQKAVNSHPALVAALEGLITAYELGNEDQLRTEVTDAYSALEQASEQENQG